MGPDVIGVALDAARQRSALRHFIGEAELYCRNPDCSIREVVLTIKEYEGPTPTRLTCPACRRSLTLHHIRTLEECRDDFERTARTSVNAQLYRHRTGEESVPIGVLLDDSLPIGGERP